MITERVRLRRLLRGRARSAPATSSSAVPADRVDWTPRAGEYTCGDIVRHLAACEADVRGRRGGRRAGAIPATIERSAPTLAAALAHLDAGHAQATAQLADARRRRARRDAPAARAGRPAGAGLAAAAGDDRARGAPPQSARVVPDVDGSRGARHLRVRRGRRRAVDRPRGGERLMSVRAAGAVRVAVRHPGRAAVHAGEPRRRLVVRRQARPARRVPVHARRVPDDVPRAAVDDADVRRLRPAGGHQRALQVPAGPGPDRTLHGVRHAGADGLRRRPSARARRSRQGRRVDLDAGRLSSGCSPTSRWATSRRR